MKHKIDENLYSRQLYVLGADAMEAFQKSHVLIVGLKGLGQEIAKNVILAGINKVTLYDPTTVKVQDLSAGFYFKYESIGQRSDHTVVKRMKELNPYVDVDILQSDLQTNSPEFVNALNNSKYTLIVLTNSDYTFQRNIKNHKIITCQTNGLLSQVFCDFGDFVVKDSNGEPCFNGIINDVSEDGVLSLLDGERHILEDNVLIKVHRHNEDKYVEYKVQVLNPFKLQLLNYNEGVFLGGSFEEVKVPFEMKFKCLNEALEDPQILNDCDLSRIIHNCYLLFEDSYIDKPEEFIDHYKSSIHKLPFKVFSPEILKAFIYMKDIELMPMVSIIGGFVAQEVLKGCSGKFTPLNQFMYFDSLECLRRTIENEVKAEENKKEGGCEVIYYQFIDEYFKNMKVEPLNNSRYYSYEKMFGKEAFEHFKNASGFVVGAGAIGCEHLKNIVMSGISLNSQFYLTDMDSIEQSNLNRQFLFRQKDVGKMKSEIALREIRVLNQDYGSNRGDYKNQLFGFVEKVGHETENIFSDTFYERITFVANALDNIDARKYVDGRIIVNRKPLFESGTLGTKGNTQVVLPDRTESYSSSSDPPEKSIPLCTLKNFPHMIEHTIEFALSEFKNSFSDKIISIKDYLSKEEHESTKGENIGEDIEEMIKKIPETLEDCFRSSFDLFYLVFYVNIKKLLNSFPADHITEQGIPFWSAPKRPPIALEFDNENEMHNLFVYSSIMLYKNAFGIEGDVDSNKIVDYFENNRETIYENASLKIESTQSNMTSQSSTNQDTSTSNEDISSFSKRVLQKLTPLEFEKDDDSNFHVDFIYACANLRAQNYKIKEATRLQVKGISGRIIPAIATTTAIVSGLSIMEVYKYILGCSFEAFRNTYLTLALPLLTSSEPITPLKEEYFFHEEKKIPHTLWDRIEFDDMTMQEFFDCCKKRFNTTVDMITIGSKTVWLSFVKTDKYNKYLNMRFSEMTEHVEGRKYLLVGILFASDCETFPNIVVNLKQRN